MTLLDAVAALAHDVGVDGWGPERRALAAAGVLVVMWVLASCGAASGGERSEPLPFVAEFQLGWNTPEEQEFVLTPPPGAQVELLPAPSPESLSALPGDEQAPLETAGPSSPVQPPPDAAPFEPTIAWVNGGEYLAVVSWGSGSCPSAPHAIDVVGEQEITIRMGSRFPDRDPCTADMSGHVTVLEMPDGISPTKPLVAHFEERDVRIEAAR